MSRRLKLFSVTGVFLSMLLLSLTQIHSQGAEQSSGADAHRVLHVAEFPIAHLSFDKLMGYDIIRLEDGDYLWEVGKPMLPCKELKVALPMGMAAKSVRVVDSKSEAIPGEYNIFPTQPPRSSGLSDENVDFVEPEKETYSSNRPYPSKLVEFVHQGDLAGQGIAVIWIYPVQYVPAEKKLTLYTSITLVIEGVGGYECGDYLPSNISERGRQTYEKMIKDMVVDPGDVQLRTGSKMGQSDVLPDGQFEHVIITSTSYASYFQSLVDWHTRKGVKDTVVTTDWIYANYAGADTQQIRAFVIDAHSTWGTTYFLMGGENETVPFAYRTYYDNESTPSDQYYSDFDDDTLHEVFVGRVSVGSFSQCTTFVNKVLKYEKDPPRTDYLLDVLLIGMDIEEEAPCEYLKDTIENHIPSRFNVTRVYDSHGGNHRDSAIAYLNAGQHLVNHADHGNYTLMCTGYLNHTSCIDYSHVDALTNNDQMSVVVAPPTCKANGMTYNDCIAEHFVIYNPNQAGVAFIGNTGRGYHGMSDCGAHSGELDNEWWISLFDRNNYNLGLILVDAKHHFSTSSSVRMHCEWTLNLLGEPEMPIWTDEPDSFAVTHPTTLSPGPSSFLVHVEDSTALASVESAYVCLWKGNEVYLTRYTDASGDVTFNPSPTTEGIVYVTVTKHNYIPYEGEANVIFTPPLVATNPATDVEETTATMHGYLEHNGGLETACWFVWDTDSGEPYAESESVGVVEMGSEFSKELAGFVEGQVYYFNTRANNSVGWDSSGGEEMFLTKPLPPTDLAAEPVSYQEIELSWAKHPSADRTVIERNDYPTWEREEGIEIYNGTGTNCKDSGLESSTHYYYQAWSYCTEETLEQYSDDYDSADTTTLQWFAPAVNYAAGDGPHSVFCADLDGDWNLDLAVANHLSDNVSILKNNGGGAFLDPVNYDVEDAPVSVFCAYLDEDLDLDLALANSESDNVSILKNNGDGTFEFDSNYAVGDAPHSVFCADLDGNDGLDLAVANAGSDDVSILKNNGDGTFDLEGNYAVGDAPYSVFCADLDGDSDMDLAVANAGSDNVSVLKNNGDGTFELDGNYAAGDAPHSVFCADLDGNDGLDLAVANAGSGNVSILINNGNGTFKAKVDYDAQDSAHSVFCADLDGDSDFDLAVANKHSDSVSILKNNGDGTFQTKVHHGVGDGPVSVFCADLDGDGDLDMAVANYEGDSVSILENLDQYPANQSPSPFSLLSPPDDDSVDVVVRFDWQTVYDPNFGDQIRYDLHVSTTPDFEPETTYSNLVVSQYTDTLDAGTYYWKVKAKDNWGAETWSTQSWSFVVLDTLLARFSARPTSGRAPLEVKFTNESIGYPDSCFWDFRDDSASAESTSTEWDPTHTYEDTGYFDVTLVVWNHQTSDTLVEEDYIWVHLVCGDCNGDGATDVADVICKINYIFMAYSLPCPPEVVDHNGDGVVDVADVMAEINYLFLGTNLECPLLK